MTSIVLGIISFITIFIIPREAAMQLTENFDFNNPRPLIRGRCPSIETRDFDVTTYDWYSSKDESCATLEIEIHNDSDPEITFFMIFGRLNHLGQRMCIIDNDQPVIMFTCASQSSSSSVDPNTGSLIMRQYGRVIEPTIGNDIRCAMYKNVEGMMHLMAISPNKSCDGLPHMPFNPQTKFPVGYVLLQPMRSRYNQRRKRSTSDTKNSIKNYSGSTFFWRTG